jgi:hypothetical protein
VRGPHQLEVIGAGELLLHEMLNPTHLETTALEVTVNSMTNDTILPSFQPELFLGLPKMYYHST